ncbi:SLC13 family permease [Thiomicrospira pelophila]|uniref:SLC13 family permease n=1 Tax=Thiomicrospira pelophila TaxID=934 RepID=UPI0004A7771B|nr:SLC13 family permease [Thiomicrospira pelophila]
MTQDQLLILLILASTMVLFVWGRWRHDIVAAMALMACVLTGLVSPNDAFLGFAHPAVITVACVLVLSRGLQNSGAVDVLTHHAMPKNAGKTLSLAALVGIGALLSGFMNNVGAMALLMPVAIQLAARLELPPGQILMPLAFGTILGGMTTLIGTPPNLIVSGFRVENGFDGFSMFDFAPVGAAVAVVGVLFTVLVGWRLVPVRKQRGVTEFETGAYLTEVRVTEESKAAGMRLREIETVLDEANAQIIAMVRNDVRINAPGSQRVVKEKDILIIEADVDALASVLSNLGLRLEESGSSSEEQTEEKTKSKSEKSTKHTKSSQVEQSKSDENEAELTEDSDKPSSQDDVVLMEFVVRSDSEIVGRSARDIQLRTRYGLNLLAVSREGARSSARLRTLRMRAGDLLLMQGPSETLTEFAADYGCVPLAERELRIPDKRKAIIATAILIGAVGIAAFGIFPTAVAFAGGVLVSMLVRTVPPTSVYKAIDWPIIVLLAALIPVAGAMQSTGTATLIANFLLQNVAQGHSVFALAVILIVTMFLSDLMNNAATAAVMCPIAVGTSTALGVNADPFLMAVAIGASCAFLTPIGHQNNTLIIGPGGFRFGDYWRLGLPVEILVVLVSIPMLLWVWPLS